MNPFFGAIKKESSILRYFMHEPYAVTERDLPRPLKAAMEMLIHIDQGSKGLEVASHRIGSREQASKRIEGGIVVALASLGRSLQAGKYIYALASSTYGAIRQRLDCYLF